MKKNTLIIIVVFILLVCASFNIGKIFGEMRNSEPMLNRCFANKEIPYENYYEIDIDEYFEYMHRLFYGEHRYKFSKIIMPEENMSYEDYYSFIGPYGHEYFLTDGGVIVECGVYK